MNISAKLIKELRDKTSAGIADCRIALEEANGNLAKAEKILQKRGLDKAAAKGGRATGEGLIESYVHQNGRVGVIVELSCETDFVARTAEFKTLAHEISMQIAAMNPKDVPVLLKQEYIRDSSKTISDLVTTAIATMGENIKVARFSRFEIGK